MKVLDILTVFKDFLRAEDDFQKNSSWVTSYKGKHWFRAVQFRLNSRNVNSSDDQILYTLNYYQTLFTPQYEFSYHQKFLFLLRFPYIPLWFKGMTTIGLNAVVIGRSHNVGLPIQILLGADKQKVSAMYVWRWLYVLEYP